MGGGGVDLAGLLLEVGGAQVQRAKSLEQESSNPVHRPSGKTQQRLVKTEFHPAHESVRDGLVVAPVLRSQHAAVAGEDAELGAFGEGAQDGLHGGTAAQQT